jgi:hypothetical protein
MSITNLIFNEEKRNEFQRENSDTFKSVLGLGAASALLVKGYNNEVANSPSTKKRNLIPTNLGKAGVQLKSSIDEAFSRRNKGAEASANQFFDDLIEGASSILQKTIKEANEDTQEMAAEKKMLKRALVNEKTYLLTAVRDAVRDLNLAGEIGDSSVIVNRINDMLESEMNRAGELSDEIKSALQSIRNNTTTDVKIDQYKRFRGLRDSSKHFSGRQKAIGVSENLVKEKPIFNTLTDAFKASIAISQGKDPSAAIEVPQHLKGLEASLEAQVTSLNERIGKFGGQVSQFVVVPEHHGELGSISAYVKGRNKQMSYPLPILMSSVKGGMRKIHRGTSSLNTPNIMPSFMPTFSTLQEIATQDISREKVFNKLKESTPERFVQEQFMALLQGIGGTVDDVSEKELNDFTAYVRSIGRNVNKGSLYRNTDSPLGQALAGALKLNQTLASTQIVGYGTNREMKAKELSELPIKLMQKFPDIFDAPDMSSVLLRQGAIPGGGGMLGLNVNLLKMDDQQMITPFTLLRGFGFKDRGTQTLTAREGQFFGREDIISGIRMPGKRGLTEGNVRQEGYFGRGKHSINILATNQNLLSVDPATAQLLKDASADSLGRVQGANMAGILFFGEGQAFSAGIAEGQGYYGGLIQTEIPLQKSVLDPANMNRPEYAFLRKLIEDGKNKKGSREFTYKGDQITELFKTYSDERGEIPLGEIDDRRVGLKKYSNLQEMTVKIEEVSKEGSLFKYNIVAKARMEAETQKTFGILGRLTSFGPAINEEGVEKAINQSYQDMDAKARLSGREIMDVYKKGFGGKMRNLIVTEAKDVSKTADFLSNFMYGGYRMLGGNDQALKYKYNSREDVVKAIQMVEGEDAIAYNRKVNRTKLIDFAQSLVRGLQDSGQKVSTTELGLLLAPMEHLAGNKKLGLESGDLVEQVLKPLNINFDEAQLEKVLAAKVAIGAGSMFSGSAPQILGRNMAKFEPRHANILFTGLRTFFGFNTEQSVKYLNDFVLRQEGIEFSGKYLPDIATTALGFKTDLSKKRIVDDRPYQSMSKETFDSLAVQAQTRFKSDPTKADQFRRKLIETLDYENPSMIELDRVVKSKDQLEKLQRIIPSGKVMLPSGRTIEGMVNYKINKGDSIENIDSRLLGNFKGLFENISELDFDPKPERKLRAISNIVDDTIQLGADAMRRSISGSVLGSISMQGSGVVLSKNYGNVNIVKEEMDNALRQFERHKGYTIFSNQIGMMDSLNTFMGASTKTDIIPDALDEVVEKNAGKKRVSKFKEFMFSHLGYEGERLGGLGLRNPTIGATHLLPGIALSRFDVSKEHNIASILTDKNKEFLSGVISGGLQLKNKEGVLLNGDINNLSSEDVYRMERAVQESPELKASVIQRRQQEVLGSFNQEVDSFFGTNRPGSIPITSLNQDAIDKSRAAIEASDTLSSNQQSSLTKSLSKLQSTISEPDKIVNSMFYNTYNNIIENFHKAPSTGVGGGEFIIPTFEADITLTGADGKQIIQRSRLDLFYSAIGDFDADTYQFFHETKGVMNKEMLDNAEPMIKNMMGASARFGIVRNLFSDAFSEMGKKLGAGNMTLEMLRADEARKEIIFKAGVGNLDVQFKSVLMGMAENRLDLVEGVSSENIRHASYMLEELAEEAMADAAGVNTQEMGLIKAKKLPFAAEIGKLFGEGLAEMAVTGESGTFENVFRRVILDNSQALREGVDISELKLIGIDSDIVKNMYSDSVQGYRIEGEKLLEAIVAGGKRAHKEGLANMASERKLGKGMASYGTRMKGESEAYFAERRSMELGLVGEPPSGAGSRSVVDKASEALDAITDRMSKMKAGATRSVGGKGMAGIIGASLVASYAIGGTHSSSALSGPDKFSDMKIKNQISERAIHNSFSREHRSPSPQSMQAPHNIYERQILKKEMYLSKPSSVSIGGNVNNVTQGRKVLESVRSMGGKGHMSIQDNVMPRPNIADYYMRE